MLKSFDEFRELGLLDQLELIIMEGVLLAQSKAVGERSFLYQIFEFFVSVDYAEPGEELKSIQCYNSRSEVVNKFQQPTQPLDPACRVQPQYEK